MLVSGVKQSDLVIHIHISRGYLSGSVVKNPPAMQEAWIRTLGWEDPLEEEMATHSCALAWRIPWTEEPGQLQPIGSQIGQDWNDLACRHTCMYLFFFKFFPHLGYYRILSRVPCYSRSLIFVLTFQNCFSYSTFSCLLFHIDFTINLSILLWFWLELPLIHRYISK